MPTERIQKLLARAGIASRRKAEELISLGLVTVNGRPAKLGDKADLSADAIKVSGKLIHGVETLSYFLLYKPRGVLSTLSDPEKRPTLASFVDRVGARIYPVGRLDFNSDGALLLTNDGALAESLQKSTQLPRIYHVKVKGHPTEEVLERLRAGTKVGPRFFKPHSVRLLSPLQSKSEVEFVVVGGGVFDVKSYFEMKRMLVDRVTRYAIGQLTIRGMTPGQLRPLVKSQVEALIHQPELGLKRVEDETEADHERIQRIQARFADRDEHPRRSDRSERPKKIQFKPSGERPERKFADKPERKFSDRSPRKFGDQPERKFSDRPPRKFGDQPERKFSDRPPRKFGDQPERKFSDRPPRKFGDKPERKFSDRPPRQFGDKPERKFSDRPPRKFGDKPERKFSDRPPRKFGDKPERKFSDRSPRKFGDQPERKFSDRSPRKFGDKPERTFQGRSQEKPQWNSERKPQWNSERKPQWNSERKPQRNSERKPQRSSEGKPKFRSASSGGFKSTSRRPSKPRFRSKTGR